jgi:glutamate/tyrosine decarboxylase-like PLP-dependent enzyme
MRSVNETRGLLRRTADHAADFLDTLDDRPVFPSVTVEQLREQLGGPLPDEPRDPTEVIDELVAGAGPGVVAIPSGRYFGFVIGGAVPAALAADWLTSAWDQNAGLYVGGPSASVVEEVAGAWLKDMLLIPQDASFAFVTGCQMANFTALAAARWHVLAQAEWDVNSKGLAGAPPVRVLCGAKVHVTVTRALRLLGLGTPEIVPADDQGRVAADAMRETLRDTAGPTIVCAQAGEVNTGAFDPLPEIADAARAAGAWLHVDGAFGLWAATSPKLAHLVAGAERADSWATDAHKWLNVPYDCGIVFCAHPDAHRAAIGVHAEYLIHGDADALRDQVDWTPEFSRRARGFTVYAALRSLGRRGVTEIVERTCAHARRFSEALAELPGFELLTDVVLNQVLFRFESDDRTDDVLRRVQESGEAWLSGTVWDGRRAIRISVSNWQTSDEDVERTLAAFEAAVYAGQAPAR